jgi:hypothetical protein
MSYLGNERAERARSHAEYESCGDFPNLQAVALQKGFRRATLSEINASAESKFIDGPDLYCWRGGLWVKLIVDSLDV